MNDEFLEIQPCPHPVSAVVEVPGSKSLTNRALILAALAVGRTNLKRVRLAEDTRLLVTCLKTLGVKVESVDSLDTLAVEGVGMRLLKQEQAFLPQADLYVGNAGTVARFLPPMLALGKGEYSFDSDPRMYDRPLDTLLDCLRAQGASIECGRPERGGLPFRLRAAGLAGGEVAIDITGSSQFASGLLLAGPYARKPLILKVTGARRELPYIRMTVELMKQFGILVGEQEGVFEVPKGVYQCREEFNIEPDLSGAAYPFAAAALVGGKVTVRGVTPSSLQGDIRFLALLKHMGCTFYEDPDGLTMERDGRRLLKGGEVDMNAFSDQALTLAALAPFCDGPVRIVNVAHIRNQECDRLRAIVDNLGALGAKVEEAPDGVTIHPGPLHGGTVETYNDHRVAMAFSLVGLKVPGVFIKNPGCVKKTFENYWSMFTEMTQTHA